MASEDQLDAELDEDITHARYTCLRFAVTLPSGVEPSRRSARLYALRSRHPPAPALQEIQVVIHPSFRPPEDGSPITVHLCHDQDIIRRDPLAEQLDSLAPGAPAGSNGAEAVGASPVPCVLRVHAGETVDLAPRAGRGEAGSGSELALAIVPRERPREARWPRVGPFIRRALLAYVGLVLLANVVFFRRFTTAWAPTPLAVYSDLVSLTESYATIANNFGDGDDAIHRSIIHAPTELHHLCRALFDAEFRMRLRGGLELAGEGESDQLCELLLFGLRRASEVLGGVLISAPNYKRNARVGLAWARFWLQDVESASPPHSSSFLSTFLGQHNPRNTTSLSLLEELSFLLRRPFFTFLWAWPHARSVALRKRREFGFLFANDHRPVDGSIRCQDARCAALQGEDVDEHTSTVVVGYDEAHFPKRGPEFPWSEPGWDTSARLVAYQACLLMAADILGDVQTASDELLRRPLRLAATLFADDYAYALARKVRDPGATAPPITQSDLDTMLTTKEDEERIAEIMSAWCASGADGSSGHPACALLAAADRFNETLGPPARLEDLRGRLSASMEVLERVRIGVEQLAETLARLEASDEGWWTWGDTGGGDDLDDSAELCPCRLISHLQANHQSGVSGDGTEQKHDQDGGHRHTASYLVTCKCSTCGELSNLAASTNPAAFFHDLATALGQATQRRGGQQHQTRTRYAAWIPSSNVLLQELNQAFEGLGE